MLLNEPRLFSALQNNPSKMLQSSFCGHVEALRIVSEASVRTLPQTVDLPSAGRSHLSGAQKRPAALVRELTDPAILNWPAIRRSERRSEGFAFLPGRLR